MSLFPGRERAVVIHGKSEEVLARLPADSVDSVVCDPPSGKKFMDRAWDADRGGREMWVSWLAGIMREAMRVLKPGGWAVVWSLPRVSHWTGCALEDAGFEMRDQLFHVFGVGFPKGLDVSKAVDSHVTTGGSRSTQLKHTNDHIRKGPGRVRKGTSNDGILNTRGKGRIIRDNPATPEGEQWNGWKTEMKPAVETWWLVRKPMNQSTAANVLEYGTGALNIHATAPESGRYTPHLMMGHTQWCKPAGVRRVRAGIAVKRNLPPEGAKQHLNVKPRTQRGPDYGFADASGTEEVTAWDCIPGCPVRVMEEQRDGASRYFPVFHYVPKPTAAEKNKGCDDLDPRDWREGTKTSTPRSGQVFEAVGRKGKDRPNNHPTPKPIYLMRWLVRLVTPPGGVVLDPFNGSGTTGVAAVREGMFYVGIEGGDKDSAYYCEVSRRRIRAELQEMEEEAEVAEALEESEPEERPRYNVMEGFA